MFRYSALLFITDTFWSIVILIVNHFGSSQLGLFYIITNIQVFISDKQKRKAKLENHTNDTLYLILYLKAFMVLWYSVSRSITKCKTKKPKISHAILNIIVFLYKKMITSFQRLDLNKYSHWGKELNIIWLNVENLVAQPWKQQTNKQVDT